MNSNKTQRHKAATEAEKTAFRTQHIKRLLSDEGYAKQIERSTNLSFIIKTDPDGKYTVLGLVHVEDNPAIQQFHQILNSPNPHNHRIFWSISTNQFGDASFNLCFDENFSQIPDFLDKPVVAYELKSHSDPSARIYAERRNRQSNTSWIVTQNGLALSHNFNWVDEEISDQVAHHQTAQEAWDAYNSSLKP